MDSVTTEPRPTFLKDYQPYPFAIDAVHLFFSIASGRTVVESRLSVRRLDADVTTLQLDGQDLELLEVRLDDTLLSEGAYRNTGTTLELFGVPESFVLSVKVAIRPEENKALEGLYRSNSCYCTQCEAEGFRRITFYPDRPDVMSRFTVRIEAEKAVCPVLLANGNRMETGDLEGGRHYAVWEDPHKKPAYLFALVAGDLAVNRGHFRTMGGREVALEIWTEKANADKCDHAMASLVKAMKWDEEVFGLEYDLDIYMIVAVDDFNMGAMENKGLNVFNSKYVLAKPETATDADFDGIEGVIAHEYFHNWTGNRVTLQNWFQLSLKEGLTVFRDQEFSSDMQSRALKRIGDVRMLRARQFAEDSGPMAHPIRPESYIEMNNFYTLTVYEKGAEVVRMLHTLLGADGFRKGMDLYVARHDGSAVTCEDFVSAMEDANDVRYPVFRNWYRQAGTPRVRVEMTQDLEVGSLTLSLSQHTPDTAGQTDKQPVTIPIRLGFIGRDGNPVSCVLSGNTATSHLVVFETAEAEVRFTGITEAVVPSLFREFSAPVIVDAGLTEADLNHLLAHDTDPFNQWDAAQQLFTRALVALVKAAHDGRELEAPKSLFAAIGRMLENPRSRCGTGSRDPVAADRRRTPVQGVRGRHSRGSGPDPYGPRVLPRRPG